MKAEIPRHRKSRIPRGSRRIRNYTFALPLFAREALGLLAAAARGWRDDNALRLGAALSFYSLLSFPPLLIVTITIAAVFFGRDAAQAGLLQQISQLLGRSGSDMFAQMIQAAGRPGGGLVAAGVGLLFVLFGAPSVFAELRDALNLIWKVQPKESNVVTGLLKGRLLALSLIVGTGFLLIISLVVSAALSALGASRFRWLLPPGGDYLLRRAARHVRALRSLPVAQWPAYLGGKGGAALAALRQARRPGVREALRRRAWYAGGVAAIPLEPWSGHLRFIQSADPRHEHDPEGWATLAGSVEVVRVPGDHTTYLGDHVDEVAAILGRWLDRV